jgi:hypothetical protein
LKFDLEYDIGKVQANQVGPKLNETHRLLAHADGVNLLRDDIYIYIYIYIYILQCKPETVNYDVKDVGVEINVKKIIHGCFFTRIPVKVIT